MEVSGQLNPPRALYRLAITSVPLEQEDWWPPGYLKKCWRREQFLAVRGIRAAEPLLRAIMSTDTISLSQWSGRQLDTSSFVQTVVVACITETSLSTYGATLGQTPGDCSLNCTATRAWELNVYLIKQGELFARVWHVSYRISGISADLIHGAKSFFIMQSRYPLQFMNPKVHDRVHNSSPIISVLSHINSVHILAFYF